MIDQSNDKSTMLNYLIDNELLLSKLYGKYANLFSAEVEFWTKISHDEIEHGSWIRALSDKVDQELLKIEDGRFKVEVLKNFGNYINSQIDRLENEKLSQIQALSISMDLENSMLERGIFDTYDTDDAELTELLEKLKHSTEIHYSEVKERWMSEKAKTIGV